jgi:hypothetical protein
VLFTSNWEKTLGTDPRAVSGDRSRQDVFLLRLEAGDAAAGGDAGTGGTAVTLPDARRGRLYAARLPDPGPGPHSWRITAGALPTGLRLGPSSGWIAGAPRTAGTVEFTVSADGGAGAETRRFVVKVTVRP